MIRDRLPAFLSAAFLLAACSPMTGLPADMASTSDAPLRLASLASLDQRVAGVAWRLSEANVDLCPAVRLSAGWMLHAARQYSPELRSHAEAKFGVRGDLPGILVVPPHSPAGSAGFEIGDLLLSVDGALLSEGAAIGPATFEGFEANLRVVDAALATGPTLFDVERNGRRIRLEVQPRRVCGYEVQLDPSDELNARADGRRLFISTALAGFARTDDELAVILGHELAHHVLQHREWDPIGGLGRERNDNLRHVEGGEGGAERQADRIGLYLAARAGYDPAVAVPFWRRFGESNWRVRFAQIGHPSAGARARALEEVEREIAIKQASGEALLP